MTLADPQLNAYLAQAGDLFARMVASSHDAMMVIGLDLNIVAWNPAAERLYGYPASDVLGRSLDLLVPEAQRSDEREILSLIIAGAQLDRYRTVRVRPDGSLIKVSLTVSPLTNPAGTTIGLTSIARGISERERSEANFQALLEAAPDAVIGVAADGRVVLANTQAEHLFTLTRHGLIGKAVTTLIPAGLPAPPSSELTPNPPVTAHRHDGSTLPVEITTSILDTDDGPVWCAVIRDVTERLQAQAEQIRLRADAERIRAEARRQRTQRLESLGQLAGGIAHDFNNLVAVILNYAAFIAEDATERGLEGIAADAEQIVRAGQRGAELTHQLLAFARREVVRPRVLDVNQIVREVEQLLRRSIGEHITLVTGLTEQLPAVLADRGQLEQVLVNLAVNARDAMPGGGLLTIDTAVQWVDDHAAEAKPSLKAGQYVQLRVSDTGTGMPKDVIEHAFEPFFTTKPSGEGTGLGLATVYGIVTQAGGDLSIYSERGMGTSVNVLLPATEQRSPEDAGDTTATVSEAQGETILVVEDETALRLVVCRMLTSAGYHVLDAETGAAALAIGERHRGPIDLLLTDVVMPQMLGKELAARLVESRPDTPVLFMSGYARPVLASHGTLDTNVVLLEKPFTRTDLLRTVRQRLDHNNGNHSV
jgi:two-component system cell cycle sensor histidine kinase/response regulator CckA